MDLSITTKSWGVGDQSWLGSADGTTNGHNGSLLVSAFAGLYPDGYLPSGVAIARLANGDIVPYDSTASDGSQNFYGCTFTDLEMRSDLTRVAGAILQRAHVRKGLTPRQSGKGSWPATAPANFIYVQ